MYFYELHEGDDDLFSDVLLARDTEMAPDVFFETVQAIRRRIKDTFEDDTLIEAIAAELESDHGFIFISDERLTAAVNVSMTEDENFLADLGAEDDEEGELEIDESDEYRTVYANLAGDGNRPN